MKSIFLVKDHDSRYHSMLYGTKYKYILVDLQQNKYHFIEKSDLTKFISDLKPSLF